MILIVGLRNEGNYVDVLERLGLCVRFFIMLLRHPSFWLFRFRPPHGFFCWVEVLEQRTTAPWKMRPRLRGRYGR